jgi:hypothetical protein
MRKLFLVLLVSGLTASPSLAEPSGGIKALDVLLVRPLSLLGSVVSTGLFIGTLPLTAPTGIAEEAAYAMVAAPWRFTGGRHIGEWSRYKDGRDIRGWSLDAPQQRRLVLDVASQESAPGAQLAKGDTPETPQ